MVVSSGDQPAAPAKGNSKARRQLEKILEDKALERLINGDFYD